MQRTFRTTPHVRAQAIGLTVLAHAIVVLLLVWLERRTPHRMQAPELQYVSIWPEPRSEPRPEPVPAVKTATPTTRASPPQPESVTPAPPNSLQQQEPTNPAEQSVRVPIDWNAASKDAAARFAGNTGGQQTFSPAPQAMRKPCKPRRLDAETQGMMAEHLPDPPDPPSVGPTPTANCIVVGGYPKCVQKLRFRRRPGLFSIDQFEKSAADRTSTSSAASPDVCD